MIIISHPVFSHLQINILIKFYCKRRKGNLINGRMPELRNLFLPFFKKSLLRISQLQQFEMNALNLKAAVSIPLNN